MSYGRSVSFVRDTITFVPSQRELDAHFCYLPHGFFPSVNNVSVLKDVPNTMKHCYDDLAQKLA